MDDLILNIKFQPAAALDYDDVIKLLILENGDRDKLLIEQFVVARDGDKLVGCIRIKELELGTAELASLVVEKLYRGKGIGKGLVGEALKHYSERPVYLLCDQNNAPFYEKSGFSIIDSKTLPEDLKALHDKILLLPFAKNIVTVSMAVGRKGQ